MAGHFDFRGVARAVVNGTLAHLPQRAQPFHAVDAARTGLAPGTEAMALLEHGFDEFLCPPPRRLPNVEHGTAAIPQA